MTDQILDIVDLTGGRNIVASRIRDLPKGDGGSVLVGRPIVWKPIYVGGEYDI